MDIYCKRINMPLPIPFYLRANVSSALTHAEVDNNFTILSTKIDNTTCGNAGVGIGIFKGKDVNTNSGTMELYSLSGANGVSVTKSGDTIIIGGGGGIIDSDWITNGNDIYNGNSGNVGIGTPSPGGLLELYASDNNSSINNRLRFRNNDTIAGPGGGVEEFIGLIDFYGNENQGDGVRAYIGTVQDGTAQTSIIFGTTDASTGITLNPTSIGGFPSEAMRIDPIGRISIGLGQINDIDAKLHVNNTDNDYSFLVEDSANPDATPFLINSGGTTSIGTKKIYRATPGGTETKFQTSIGDSGLPFSGLPISTTALFESDTSNNIGLISPDANVNQIYFGTPSDAFGAYLRWDYTKRMFILSTGNVSGKTIFQTGNGVEAVRIDENGNVGIGTSNPPEKLTVFGDALIAGAGTGPATLTLSGSSFSDCQIKFENIGVSEPFAEIRGNTFGGGTSGNIEFFTYPSGGPLTKGMTITNNGRVGIGDINNNDITADLHVSGTTKMLNTLTLVKTPVNNNSATEILVRNSSSGDVEYRNGGTFNSGLFAQTGDSATVTNTTDETTILGGGVGTLSVPANSFQIGNSYSLNMGGKLRTDGASQSITIRIDAISGSSRVELGTSGVIDLDNLNTLNDFVLEVEFTVRNTGGPGTASLMTSGYFDYVKTNGDLEGALFSSLESTNFDTTVTKTLDVTVEWGAASTDNQIYSHLAILRKIY